MTSPDKPFVPIDREDQETDKLGSADLARNRLFGETAWKGQRIGGEKPKKPLSSAQRRKNALVAQGPQYGEDALEVVDNSDLTVEDANRVHYYTRNWRQVAADAIKNGTHKVEED